jgi:hypothetical protein
VRLFTKSSIKIEKYAKKRRKKASILFELAYIKLSTIA